MIMQSTIPTSKYEKESSLDERFEIRPRVRIAELEDKINFVVEMPGVDKKSIHLAVNDENVMTVRAERQIESDSDEILLRNEINTVTYKRSFILPNKYETEKIEANLKNGMLKISIPRKETFKPKSINIK